MKGKRETEGGPDPEAGRKTRAPPSAGDAEVRHQSAATQGDAGSRRGPAARPGVSRRGPRGMSKGAKVMCALVACAVALVAGMALVDRRLRDDVREFVEPDMTPEQKAAQRLRERDHAARLYADAVEAVAPLVEKLGPRRQRIAAGRRLPADFTELPDREAWPNCSNATRPKRAPVMQANEQAGSLVKQAGSLVVNRPRMNRFYYVVESGSPPTFRMTRGEMTSRGWVRVGPQLLCEAEYVFANGQRRIAWGKLARHHIPNHLFEERHIADKSTLADILAAISEEGVPTPFWPETYWLRDDVDRAVLMHVLAADPTPSPPFLMKNPRAHRGTGVRFLEPYDVYDMIEKLRIPGNADSDGHDIVQRYVPNPLLLPPHGRKFDLRIYWFIACTNPVRVYYHDGTTRSSLESFDPENLHDMGQHLTNVAVQKQSPELYAEAKDELRLSFDALEDVLLQIFPSHPNPMEDVRAQIRHAIATVFLAGKEKLAETRFTDRAFSLIGGDFIIGECTLCLQRVIPPN